MVSALKRGVMVFMLGLSFNLAAIESNPLAGKNPDREPESALRRGEVIFFISYPFTFLGSFLAYDIAGAAMTAIDGKSNFSATGGGFYAVVAATAAILSFGIAMNDHYLVTAQTKNTDGSTSGLLSLTYRF